MLLVQISDTHLRTTPAPPRHDPALSLAQAVTLLNTMAPRPDLIVFTGDVIDRAATDYSAAVQALRRLSAPLLVLPGNHDRAAPFRAAFAGLQAGGSVSFAAGHQSVVATIADHVVIGLDSTSEEGPALLDDARLAWTEQALADARGPVVLALHHPPFAVGIPRLDRAAFPGAARLEALVRASGKVTRVIAGHSHRAVHGLWAGVQASTAPALGHALALSFHTEAPHAHTAEPPGLHLHLMRDGAWMTHTVLLGNTAPPSGFATALSAEQMARLVSESGPRHSDATVKKL